MAGFASIAGEAIAGLVPIDFLLVAHMAVGGSVDGVQVGDGDVDFLWTLGASIEHGTATVGAEAPLNR